MSEFKNVDDIFKGLTELLKDKNVLLNSLSVAVNEFVQYKNKYVTMSNELRIKPDVIKVELGLSKAATEKQQQAYIDDKLSFELQSLRVAEEHIKLLKRDLDLLDDRISLEKYRVKMFLSIVNQGGIEFE